MRIDTTVVKLSGRLDTYKTNINSNFHLELNKFFYSFTFHGNSPDIFHKFAKVVHYSEIDNIIITDIYFV